MFAEHNRRQDLIRWGFYNMNDKWVLPDRVPNETVRTDGAFRYIFPINKNKLAANKNLVQNPGYSQ